jgi:hypothetical protein
MKLDTLRIIKSFLLKIFKLKIAKPVVLFLGIKPPPLKFISHLDRSVWAKTFRDEWP